MSQRTECVFCGASLAHKKHKAALYCSDECRKLAYNVRKNITAAGEDLRYSIECMPRMPEDGDPSYWHEVIGDELEAVEKALQAKMLDISGTYQTSYILTKKGRAMLAQFRGEK